MLVSFLLSATLSQDQNMIEDYIWSGNIPIEATFQLLAKVLVLEAEKKARESTPPNKE